MCDKATAGRFDKIEIKIDKLLELGNCHSVDIAELKKDIKANSEQHLEINKKMCETTDETRSNTRFINALKGVLIFLSASGIISFVIGIIK